jgi:hypothetical protein
MKKLSTGYPHVGNLGKTCGKVIHRLSTTWGKVVDNFLRNLSEKSKKNFNLSRPLQIKGFRLLKVIHRNLSRVSGIDRIPAIVHNRYIGGTIHR